MLRCLVSLLGSWSAIRRLWCRRLVGGLCWGTICLLLWRIVCWCLGFLRRRSIDWIRWVHVDWSWCRRSLDVHWLGGICRVRLLWRAVRGRIFCRRAVAWYRFRRTVRGCLGSRRLVGGSLWRRRGIGWRLWRRWLVCWLGGTVAILRLWGSIRRLRWTIGRCWLLRRTIGWCWLLLWGSIRRLRRAIGRLFRRTIGRCRLLRRTIGRCRLLRRTIGWRRLFRRAIRWCRLLRSAIGWCRLLGRTIRGLRLGRSIRTLRLLGRSVGAGRLLRRSIRAGGFLGRSISLLRRLVRRLWRRLRRTIGRCLGLGLGRLVGLLWCPVARGGRLGRRRRVHHVDGRLVDGLVDENGQVVVRQGHVLDRRRGSALAAAAPVTSRLGLKWREGKVVLITSSHLQMVKQTAIRSFGL